VNMESPAPAPAPVPDVKSGKELRIHGRRRMRMPGKVVFGSRSFALDSTIRDLSASGARIAVSNPDHIPLQFVLIEPENFLAFESKVEWRRSNLIGLSFNKAISLNGNLDPPHQLLRMHAHAAKREWRI